MLTCFLIRGKISQYGVVARLPLPDVVAVYIVDDTIVAGLSFPNVISIYVINYVIVAGLPFSDVIAVYVIDDAIEGRLPHSDIIAIYVANNCTCRTLSCPDQIVTFMKHTPVNEKRKYIIISYFQ